MIMESIVDERSNYRKMLGKTAEEVMSERMTIEKSVEEYRNSFVEYIEKQNIAKEVLKQKEKQKEMERRVEMEEEKKESSWLYKLLSKLKKTV